ncbi:MAG TPA: molybdate ABC transporter substrate-binding protein, partial [Gallionella sp.]|nr:molybdate ABC transporter substrate-binding protein [Gallionella sp.]
MARVLSRFLFVVTFCWMMPSAQAASLTIAAAADLKFALAEVVE